MTRTLTTRFFDEKWHADNAQDLVRAAELHAEARRKKRTMTDEEYVADAERILDEAEAGIAIIAAEDGHGTN